MVIFQYMEDLVLNHVDIPVENQDMENFLDLDISRIWKLNITNSIP